MSEDKHSQDSQRLNTSWFIIYKKRNVNHLNAYERDLKSLNVNHKKNLQISSV